MAFRWMRKGLALALVTLLAACPPPNTGVPGIPTAQVLVDGVNVTVNGQAISNGARLRSGWSVDTGAGGSALVLFSDNTRVQIAEGSDPVRFSWQDGRTLRLEFDDATIEAQSGSSFSVFDTIGRIAEFFSFSSFAVEEVYPQYFRVDLWNGQIRFKSAEARNIGGGEYALIRPGQRSRVGRTSAARRQELRARFDRWQFSSVPTRLPEVQRTRVPRVTGMTYAQARGVLKEAGFDVFTLTRPSNRAVVLTQTPVAGAVVRTGTDVVLTFRTVGTGQTPGNTGSSGTGSTGSGSSTTGTLSTTPATTVVVPRLTGSSLSQARAYLERSGLRLGRLSPSDPSSRMVVVEQSPAAGRRVERGTRVSIRMQAVIQ
jgi:hypothetical protein